MVQQKSIVVGCGSSGDLSVLLHSLSGLTNLSHHTVSASRLSDLFNIAKSLDPDLIILCYRNNQEVLDDFDSIVKKPGIPILCINATADSEPMQWNPQSIVLSCQLQHVQNQGYLQSRINSIFLMNRGTVSDEKSKSLEEKGTREESAGHHQDLSRYVMELDQKSNVLSNVTKRISDLFPDVDDKTRIALNSIVNSIRMSENNTKLREDLKLYFEMTDPDFLLTLAKKHPELTAVDLKYCCYLKMNLSNDDIRSLLGINQESVRTHKYRLKRKLDIPRDMDLSLYLKSVS
jgi:DNA-binding CsgD family transcriptional regulator